MSPRLKVAERFTAKFTILAKDTAMGADRHTGCNIYPTEVSVFAGLIIEQASRHFNIYTTAISLDDLTRLNCAD